ncbi:MAG: amidohydrolase [Kangiellaceae bacterium]|nr:amidohydrolase [Kangiellaceae bacterium]
MKNYYLLIYLLLVLKSNICDATQEQQAQMVDQEQLEQQVKELMPKVIEWRRHLHKNPELSNREFNTAIYIAEYLKKLGLSVETKVAHTGVVAILDSGKPGPTVALRADMDALPIREAVKLPFRSNIKGEYNGKIVPVMHACGHDAHMAMLMGAAKILNDKKNQLRGKVKFIFQPAEEGAPDNETGGAEVMVQQGVMNNVDTIFGLHVNSHTDVGIVKYRHGGILASVDPLKIVITGKQAHGAYPWLSVDPITTAAQVIMGLQTIVSRELVLLDDAAVVTVGSIHGGNRSNIIPEEVVLEGTIRTLNEKARKHIHEAITRKVSTIASSMRAEAEVYIAKDYSYPVTYNQPELMDQMLPSLVKSAGKKNVVLVNANTAAEDFSYFQKEVPGLYLLIGGKPLLVKEEESSDHHSPHFFIDESGMSLGVKLFVNMTIDYMNK